MTDLKNKVIALNELVAAFNYKEAHKKFYHSDLVKHENEDAPTVGLENHKKEMTAFLSCIFKESAKVMNVIISDDMSVTEWHYQFEHAQWGKRDFKEISIQRWKDGKVIHERHMYKTKKW